MTFSLTVENLQETICILPEYFEDRHDDSPSIDPKCAYVVALRIHGDRVGIETVHACREGRVIMNCWKWFRALKEAQAKAVTVFEA